VSVPRRGACGRQCGARKMPKYCWENAPLEEASLENQKIMQFFLLPILIDSFFLRGGVLMTCDGVDPTAFFPSFLA